MATKKTVTEEKEAGRARVYEIGYHILPTVEGEKIEQVVQNIRTVVQEAGGNLLAEGAPQEMRLAYTMYINNQGKNTAYDRAHFGWLKFEMTSDALAAIEEILKSDRNILRAIAFKTVREDTRAGVRAGALKEVRRGDTLKTTKRVEEVKEEVSEEKLDEAIEDLMGESNV